MYCVICILTSHNRSTNVIDVNKNIQSDQTESLRTCSYQETLSNHYVLVICHCLEYWVLVFQYKQQKDLVLPIIEVSNKCLIYGDAPISNIPHYPPNTNIIKSKQEFSSNSRITHAHTALVVSLNSLRMRQRAWHYQEMTSVMRTWAILTISAISMTWATWTTQMRYTTCHKY